MKAIVPPSGFRLLHVGETVHLGDIFLVADAWFTVEEGCTYDEEYTAPWAMDVPHARRDMTDMPRECDT